MYNISVFMMHLLRYRSELTKTHTAMVAPCQPPEEVIGNIWADFENAWKM